eukprot:766568-Hanusia_phi.AAC.3
MLGYGSSPSSNVLERVEIHKFRRDNNRTSVWKVIWEDILATIDSQHQIIPAPKKATTDG